MWIESYEALSSFEKGEFRRIGNYLLSHTFLNRYYYNPFEQMTLPNKDYQIAMRFFNTLQVFFELIGWRIEKDDICGYMSITNTYDHNRFRMEQFTTLFLYTCRLIYEEQREHPNSSHMVIASTYDVIQKMSTLNLLKSGKSTQKERLDAQRTLAHFNIIEKMESTGWESDGNRFLILPSILAIISTQGINEMMAEFAEMPVEPDYREEDKA
jgi:hypothetical protein